LANLLTVTLFHQEARGKLPL